MKKDKEMCAGCYNNEYNYGLGGAKECWSFKSAKVIDRIPIGVDQPPPYDKSTARKMLSCFNRRRMAYPSPDDLTSTGYWK